MTRQEFEHIAKMLRPQLVRIGEDFFEDSDAAEDVAQEVLMRLWLMQERIETKSVSALASRMAKNYCVSQWRKQKSRQTVGIDHSILAHNIPPDSLEMQDEERQLQQALATLSRPEQRLFRMRHELDMDIQEIAAATGILPRSISAMLSAARRKITEIIKKGGI